MRQVSISRDREEADTRQFFCRFADRKQMDHGRIAELLPCQHIFRTDAQQDVEQCPVDSRISMALPPDAGRHLIPGVEGVLLLKAADPDSQILRDIEDFHPFRIRHR